MSTDIRTQKRPNINVTVSVLHHVVNYKTTFKQIATYACCLFVHGQKTVRMHVGEQQEMSVQSMNMYHDILKQDGTDLFQNLEFMFCCLLASCLPCVPKDLDLQAVKNDSGWLFREFFSVINS